MSVHVRPFGAAAVLAETATLADALALHAALDAAGARGIVDLVPAARTVLVVFDPARTSAAAVRAVIADAAATAHETPPIAPASVDVPIRYDGPDLADTAALLGIRADELVARHRAAEWTVAFTGFAPGFAYLTSPDWPYDVPRLSSPRTRVPAGAVGVAGVFCGAYPRETPGGWRLLGTTGARLFDPASAAPVLLPPGTRVRFVEDDTVRAPAGAAAPADEPATPGLCILDPGAFTSVQDLGRPAHAALGIARSGALDRAALRRANRLVGNPEDAAGFEVLAGGLRAVAERDLWIALTGAAGPFTIAGRAADPYAAVRWPAGTELHVGAFTAGVRGYLAVRGGIDAARVGGSAATDTLAGLGPAAARAGTRWSVGPEPAARVPAVDGVAWSAPAPGELEIDLAAGPRADRFAADALPTLFEAVWTVTADADRVGMRLDGPALRRIDDRELASEGMVPGAVQVPPSGRPTILLADGPVTGGYPVIAVVTEAGLDLLAQARPGQRVRFRHARVPR